jgi:hypothetical protein
VLRTDHATQQTTFRRKDARRYVVADKNRKTYINDGSDGRERPRRRHKTGKDCLTDTREVRVYDYGGKFTNLFDIYIIMIFFWKCASWGICIRNKECAANFSIRSDLYVSCFRNFRHNFYAIRAAHGA